MWRHWYVWGVIFPRLKVTGMLHSRVPGRSDPRGASVNQRASLCQKVRRRSEIPTFHPDKKTINPKSRAGNHENRTERRPDVIIPLRVSLRSCIQHSFGSDGQKSRLCPSHVFCNTKIIKCSLNYKPVTRVSDANPQDRIMLVSFRCGMVILHWKHHECTSIAATAA